MLFSVDEQIGRRVRKRRLILGLTQAQLGAKVGVRFQQIQKYECAENKMSADMLWRLSGALDVPTSFFFEAIADCGGVNRTSDGKVHAYGPSLAEIDTMTKLVGRLKPRVQKHLLALAQSFAAPTSKSVTRTASVFGHGASA